LVPGTTGAIIVTAGTIFTDGGGALAVTAIGYKDASCRHVRAEAFVMLRTSAIVRTCVTGFRTGAGSGPALRLTIGGQPTSRAGIVAAAGTIGTGIAAFAVTHFTCTIAAGFRDANVESIVFPTGITGATAAIIVTAGTIFTEGGGTIAVTAIRDENAGDASYAFIVLFTATIFWAGAAGLIVGADAIITLPLAKGQ
jgi:hypothetical protein